MDKKKEITETNGDKLYANIRQVLNEARKGIVHSVNKTIVNAYWQVGRYIVEYEQNGVSRAEYGKNTLSMLSEKLKSEFGSGFTITNLKLMRQFYIAFPNGHALRDELSWTHYRSLLKVKNNDIRLWYMEECVRENWSTRQLDRQINTLFYERMLASRDKETVRKEIKNSAPVSLQPKEIIRDPYILDFIGIPQGDHFLEGDLEEMLISKLQHFLLELGKGYSFVARQKRISFVYRPCILQLPCTMFCAY